MSQEAPGRPTRVMLIEDEAMTRALVGGLLTGAGYDVRAFENAASAAEAFAQFRPTAIVTDIDLHQGPSGIDLIIALKRRSPTLRVIILSSYFIAPDHRHAALAGAAYLNKREINDPSIVLDTLAALLLETQPPAMDARSAAGRLDALTLSQAEVLRMVAAGMTNEEIASRRVTSVKSVENMIHRIIGVLGLPQDSSSNSRVLAARIFITEAGAPALPRPNVE